MSSSPVEKLTTPVERLVIRSMMEQFVMLQAMFQIDQISFFALIGSAAGELAASNDALMEKDEEFIRFTKGDETVLREPLKRTILVNIDATYNQFRSHLERKEKLTPKKEV